MLLLSGCYNFSILDRAADQGTGGDMASGPPDLLTPPMPTITTVLVRGSRNDPTQNQPVYEAEGNSAQPGSGVAVLIRGTGFYAGSKISSPDGRFIVDDTVYVNGAGTELFASFRLAVDNGNSGGTQQYPVQVSNGPGLTASTTFPVIALPEQIITAGPFMTSQSMYAYSQLTFKGAITFPGPQPVFFWVSGPVVADTDLTVGPGAGGSHGCVAGANCSTNCNATSGPGSGQASSDNIHSAGGAGYSMAGSPGSPAGGPQGGAIYGDETVIGVPGGSGGGCTSQYNGGDGGGVLRIVAGSIDLGPTMVTAFGGFGQGSTTVPGSGAGSGGTVLLQAWYFLRANASVLGGKSAGVPVGGVGAQGRVRFDSGSGSGPLGVFAGPMFDAKFQTVWQGTLDHVDVVCTGNSKFNLTVDGQPAGSPTCPVNPSVGTHSFALTPPLGGGATHTICTVLGGTSPARYMAPYSENTNCRGFVVAP
jgi:hypothetical protein